MDQKEIHMKIPGFTGDASLSVTVSGYLRVATARYSTRGSQVVPQQRHDYCFYAGPYWGYICCSCTPDEGCSCRSPGETQF